MILKQITGTTITRILTTGLGFLTVILATRFLGAEGYGNISLFILTIALMQLVAGIAGGPALVYLVPRIPAGDLFLGSLTWSLLVHIAGFLILNAGAWVDSDLPAILTGISFTLYLNTFAYTVLLGQKRIMQFNLILLLQAFIMILLLSIFIGLSYERSFRIYLLSFFISHLVSAAIGWLMILKSLKGTFSAKYYKVMGKMIRYGGFLQMANGVQLLNYRLSFFLIDHFLGRSVLGIYNAGVQLSEGIWIFGKSFAVVQYSNISNNDDPRYATRLTLAMMKAVIIITILCILILVVLPGQFYSLVFGKEFGMVKIAVLYLSPGILAMAVSQIFSHYFSGTGKQHHNAVGSAAGLIVTLICGFTLIPAFGIAGAGLTASFAYIVIALYQLVVFVRLSESKAGDFMLRKEDIKTVLKLLKKPAQIKPVSDFSIFAKPDKDDPI
jgi:O-antigen/teichoic acid export membrane protein